MKRPTQHQAPFAPSLTIIGLFLLAGLALGGASSATPTPLHTFHPGSPDSPAWTVLALEVERAGAVAEVRLVFEDLRCPMALAFQFLQGPPDHPRAVAGMFLDYANGFGGHRVFVAEGSSVLVEEDAIATHPEDRCESVPSYTFRFRDLPQGRLHFIQYAAGVPFGSTADLLAPGGGIAVVGVSSGDSTFYVDTTEFSKGSVHAAVYSPGMESRTSYWAGGTLFGVEASAGRSAAIEFRDRPHFDFSPTAATLVSNATVTDPLGRVLTQPGRATVGGITGMGGWISSWESPWPLSAGTYRFDIHASAQARAVAPVTWKVSGADYYLPGEEEKG